MRRRKMSIRSREGGRRSPAYRPDRQEADSDKVVPDNVRSAAVAAFNAQDLDDVVLDLVADTQVYLGPGTTECMRRLRFAGHGWVAVVDVQGRRNLTLDVRISPDQPATMEVRTADTSGRVETQLRGRSPFSDVPPGLMTLLIRGREDFEHKLARTAWVCL